MNATEVPLRVRARKEGSDKIYWWFYHGLHRGFRAYEWLSDNLVATEVQSYAAELEVVRHPANDKEALELIRNNRHVLGKRRPKPRRK